MKVTKSKAKGLKIRPPPSSRVLIETPPDAFEHHCIMTLIGKRGSGKSTAACSYLKMMKNAGKADRVIVISPTAGSNMALMESLKIDPEDVLDPDIPHVVDQYRAVLNEERDTYVKELKRKRRYKKFKKLYLSNHTNVNHLLDDDLLEFTQPDGTLVPEPTLKYGQRPIIHLWIDDSQSTPLFNNRKFLNSVIKHRHEAPMPFVKGDNEMCGALGISMYICCQNFKSSHGGLPRAIRNNSTVLAVIGKSQDKKELEDIFSSVAGEVTQEDFFKAYEYATREKHGSFFIDLHPKKTHPSRFRKGLDEYILLE